MYVNFLSTYSEKSPACIPQQLYKPSSRGLSAIAELLVLLVVSASDIPLRTIKFFSVLFSWSSVTVFVTS